MEWDSLINLFTLYKSSIEHKFIPTSYHILLIVKFNLHFLNVTADDMPAKTDKSKVYHSFKARLDVLTTTNEPVANIIDGNVQLNVHSHIPDNFQV